MTGSMSRDIGLALIDPDPDQPRKRFDATEIDGLAESIAATGLAVPIMVRPDHDRFVIVHGERRWRACRQLGWKTIPANVTEIDAKAAWWLALVENIQRADLSPLEEAAAYRRSLATGLSQTDLGRRIGKSQSYIAHKLRLLTLPADVQAAVDDRRLSESHARQLLRLEAPAQQSEFASWAAAGGWSVQRMKDEVDRMLTTLTPSELAELAELEARIEANIAWAREQAPPDIATNEAYWSWFAREVELWEIEKETRRASDRQAGRNVMRGWPPEPVTD